MKLTVLIPLFFLCILQPLYSITFITTVQKLASVNILLTKNNPVHMTANVTQSAILVECVCMTTAQNKVILFKKINNSPFSMSFQPLAIPTIPTNCNVCAFTITPEELQELAGDGDQIYVIIRQSTYSYVRDPLHALVFFKYSLLQADFYNRTATVNIEAEGIIAPSMIHTVPPSLRTRYVEAHGFVS